MAPKSGRSWKGHHSAYQPWDDPKVHAVKLPDKLKCGVCKRVKPCNDENFSKTQLLEMKKRITKHGMEALLTAGAFHCWPCTTARERTDILCTICDRTLPLAEFAKNQRGAETARCKGCVRKQLIYDTEFEDNPHGNGAERSGEKEDTEHVDNQSEISDMTSVIAASTITDSTDGGVLIPVTIAKTTVGFPLEDDDDDHINIVSKETALENFRPTQSVKMGALDQDSTEDWVTVGKKKAGKPLKEFPIFNQDGYKSTGSTRGNRWAKPYNPNKDNVAQEPSGRQESDFDFSGGKGGGEDDEEESDGDYF